MLSVSRIAGTRGVRLGGLNLSLDTRCLSKLQGSRQSSSLRKWLDVNVCRLKILCGNARRDSHEHNQ